jgi:hypothetical protein
MVTGTGLTQKGGESMLQVDQKGRRRGTAQDPQPWLPRRGARRPHQEDLQEPEYQTPNEAPQDIAGIASESGRCQSAQRKHYGVHDLAWLTNDHQCDDY